MPMRTSRRGNSILVRAQAPVGGSVIQGPVDDFCPRNFIEEDDETYLIIEYIDGETLEELLQ